MKCRHRGQFLFNGTPLLFMFNCLLCTLILIRKDVVSSILYSGYGYSYLFFMFKMKRERERGGKKRCSTVLLMISVILIERTKKTERLKRFWY